MPIIQQISTAFNLTNNKLSTILITVRKLNSREKEKRDNNESCKFNR